MCCFSQKCHHLEVCSLIILDKCSVKSQNVSDVFKKNPAYRRRDA